MSEADMCGEFMGRARERGWSIYPEWQGWDMLAAKDGVQVGIEAKTRANIKVLSQAISPREGLIGPEYHAVLVPKCSPEFREVAGRLKVYTLIAGSVAVLDGPWLFRRPVLTNHWRWDHAKPLDLPPVEELNAPAGVPSPSGLTPWKLKAIKLWLVMERRGWVTSKDFKALGISPAFWVGRWIHWDGTKDGRCQRYVPWVDSPHGPRPDEQHPEVMAALRSVDARL